MKRFRSAVLLFATAVVATAFVEVQTSAQTSAPTAAQSRSAARANTITAAGFGRRQSE